MFPAISAPPPALKKYAESSQLSLTLGATLTFTHGMGLTAKFVQVWLECTTADGGYSIGDYVLCNGGQYHGAYGIDAVIDSATAVKGVIGANGITVPNKGTGANVNITLASWRARLRCAA